MREEVITSRQNPHIVRIAKLAEKKYRYSEGLFRFDGIKLFSEAVSSGAVLEYILIREGAAEKICPIVEREGENGRLDSCRIMLLSDALFDKISEEKSPEGIICVAKHIDKLRKIATINIACQNFEGEDALGIGGGEKILLLESMRDAGNLGTVIRSALAFGIDRLIISSDCADLYNPKTVRAAMGAIFKMRIDVVDDLADAIGVLRQSGRRVFAAALNRDAARLGSFSIGGDSVVIGNEGHGLSERVIEACDGSVFIPISEESESLNAATAAAICMWEMTR